MNFGDTNEVTALLTFVDAFPPCSACHRSRRGLCPLVSPLRGKDWTTDSLLPLGSYETLSALNVCCASSPWEASYLNTLWGNWLKDRIKPVKVPLCTGNPLQPPGCFREQVCRTLTGMGVSYTLIIELFIILPRRRWEDGSASKALRC